MTQDSSDEISFKVGDFDVSMNARAARSEYREPRLLLYFMGGFLVFGGLTIAFVIGPKSQFGPYQQLALGLALIVAGGLIFREIAVNWNYPLRLQIDSLRVTLTYPSGRLVEKAWSSPRLRLDIYDLRGTLAAAHQPSLTEIRAVFKPGPDVFLSPEAHLALLASARSQGLAESLILMPRAPNSPPLGRRFEVAHSRNQ